MRQPCDIIFLPHRHCDNFNLHATLSISQRGAVVSGEPGFSALAGSVHVEFEVLLFFGTGSPLRRCSMGRRIYVGNLPWSTTSDELSRMFSEHGGVKSAEVLSDRETGRSRGFGFVEMESDQALEAAIAALNGKDMGGR